MKRDRLNPNERQKRYGRAPVNGAHGKAKNYLWARRVLMDKIDMLTEELSRSKRFNMPTLELRKSEAELAEARAQLDALESREYDRLHASL